MTNPTILLVDDIPTNLFLLHEFLTDTTHPCYRDYNLITTGNGLDALALLESEPERFNAVLLDIMMPDMDGLAVLSHMKAHPVLSEIPVIFQTAKNSSAEFAIGIQAGAYYYLTKPLDQNYLLAILRSALENSQSRNALRQAIHTTANGISLIRSLQMEFRTMEEARQAAVFLTQAYPDPQRVGIGILELLYNAVEHGNLNLTYDDKSRLFEEDLWEQEIQRRLQLPEYAEKFVKVQLQRTATEIRLTITDHGKGFNWNNFMTFNPQRLTHPHGRGIAIANTSCFDTLQFLGCGNQVTTTLKLQD